MRFSLRLLLSTLAVSCSSMLFAAPPVSSDLPKKFLHQHRK